jgi:microcystin degradation protein MlrC
MTGPRVALLGFSIECNRFAPIAFETDFRARTLLGGEIMLANARSPAPMMLGEMPGFVADMDAAGPWQPLPGLLAMAEPNGPVSQEFFDRMMVQWESDLRAAASLDGVYCVLHGAGLTVNDHDPEGTLLTMVRRVVGDKVPVVATYDLHANVSPANVDLVNAYIGYRTNPHLDMRERGAEAAQNIAPSHDRNAHVPVSRPPADRSTDRDHADRSGRACAPVWRTDRSRSASPYA